MLDVVVKDGKACGIVTRDLVTGEISSHSAHAVVLATGGYSNVFYLSTNAMNCNVTAAWRAHSKGALFANPCFTQIHPTCIPASDEFQSKLTLMSESLRNDGRIWVPKNPDETRPPDQIPEADRDYFLERKYPAFGNLVPRDVASRNAKTMVDRATASARSRTASTSTSATPSSGSARASIRERYGNLFDMYERITDENPYQVPMRIYPATHYTMGGLWVDYNLMTTVPGLYALGEANFSDHGANRLGASALMQGLADGYFVLPYTIGDYLSGLLGHPGRAHRRPGVHRGRSRPHRRRSTAGCRSAAPSRSTTTTASSARSCGTTAAWPATVPASRRPSPRSRPCATSSERTSGSSARPRRSTSRSRRCSGSPTSSSWPS